jgi:hypothetical protein
MMPRARLVTPSDRVKRCLQIQLGLEPGGLLSDSVGQLSLMLGEKPLPKSVEILSASSDVAGNVIVVATVLNEGVRQVINLHASDSHIKEHTHIATDGETLIEWRNSR